LSIPKREEILKILADRRDLLQDHGVSSIALFGSIVRGEATEKSDVDLLVEFSRPIGLLEFVALKRELETVLGRSVDLATRASPKPQLRERILKEAVRAA
jgi:predicted nucleotidyltransferase